MHLYGFGSNGSGQLGVGHVEDIARPEKCYFSYGHSSSPSSELPANILRLVAEGNRTHILLETGTVLCAGRQQDESGNGQIQNEGKGLGFEPVAGLTGITTKLCSSTWEASFFVDEADNIYVAGAGPKGELGLGPDVLSCDQVKRLDRFLPRNVTILDIASSVSHTIIVTSGGDVYGWGNGRKGQLGEPSVIVWSPRKVEGLAFKVTRAVCGREFTSLLGDSREGRFTVLGSDKWQVRSSAPNDVVGWKEFGASWGSLFALNSEGVVKPWGRNDRGQLGPTKLPTIQHLAIGSEHALAQTKAGVILCWGWGEHGNCGQGTNEDGNVQARGNEIPLSEKDLTPGVLGIAAGCATSFIWTAG